MNNEGYLKQIIKEAVVEALNESIIINEKDILYHKKEFDSGEINLCFVIGHSGSGKSTLTYNAAMKDQDKIDTYSLDDLMCVADYFTMKQLKEYGDLIYSFFKGPGKKYYVTYDYLKDNNIHGSEYEDKLFPDFVHYSMKYAAAHKNKKFYIEGVWLFCNGDDGKPWFTPEEFKDYAFYIKGTSMIISHIRAAKRDSKDSKHKFKSFMKMVTKNWKWYHIDEKRINRFRSYFKKLMSTNVEESVNQSSLDKQFKKKSGKSFNIIDIGNTTAIKYMKQDGILSKNLDYIGKHRIGEIAVCDGKLAGYIFVTKSGEIQPIHIFEEYRGYGLSNTLMKDGIEKYGARKLGVYSDNLVAIKLYKKFGFKVVGNKVYKDGSKILFMERR